MSGFDHDYLLPGSYDSLTRRLLARLRRSWPDLAISFGAEPLSYAAALKVDGFPDYVQVAKNAELLRWSDRNGLVSTPDGDAAFDVMRLPARATVGIHVDIVTAEPTGHPFTTEVLRHWWWAVSDSFGPARRTRSGGTTRLSLRAELDAAWMARGVRACISRDVQIDARPGVTVVPTAPAPGEDSAFELRAVGIPGRSGPPDPAVAVFRFRRDGTGCSECTVEASTVATVEWRVWVESLLREAAVQWFAISYRDMATKTAFTAPPGEPVARGSVLEFEGTGGTHHFDR